MSHTTTLKRNGLPTMSTLTRRILRVFDAATPADLEAGARWYGDATELAMELAPHAGSLEHAAGVLAALSPRTPWTRNVAGAVELIRHGSAMDGLLRSNVERARAVLERGSEGLGGGPKVRSFAANIAGDREAVTVDVWAFRAVGLEDERIQSRAGVYDAVSHSYRLAARRRGVDPATMQATVWVVVRNGRAK